MSAVNLCERCDSLMLGKAVGSLDLQKSEEARNERIELCPACIGDLVAFLAEHPVRDRTTFREGWKPEAKRTDSQLMLENGYCGNHPDDGEAMCLRPKGHEGNHVDGAFSWGQGY